MSQTDYGADDPFWIDQAWLDTVVVVGLTCFILCLMNLSKVRVVVTRVGVGVCVSLAHKNGTLIITCSSFLINSMTGSHIKDGNVVRYCW